MDGEIILHLSRNSLPCFKLPDARERFTKFSVAWAGTAAEQAEYMRDLQFMANEKFLAAELPWGKMAVVAVIRHPFDRLLSEAKYTGLKCLASSSKKKRGANHRLQASSFEQFVACTETNFMVRRLCGCKGNPATSLCRNTPPLTMSREDFQRLTMNETHLECALKRLNRFSLVLVTELLEYAGPLLTAKFGWRVDIAQSRGGTKRESSVFEEFGHEKRTMSWLHSKHDLDLKLYEHAKVLQCREMAQLEQKNAGQER